jgi:hypothetical protein
MARTAAAPAPIAAADWLRRRWLHLLGDLARPLMTRRELRVSLLFSAMIVSATAATLIFPLWLLILGPLLWGVPHLVSDLRYLVVRTGYHRRPAIWLLAGAPLLYTAVGGDLVWGFVGAAAAAVVARAALVRRVIVIAAIAAIALAFHLMGRTGDVVFAHAHNFIAVGLWWAWRPRSGRLHWIPLALLILASLFLLSDAALWLVHATGGLTWYGGNMNASYQAWRLSPGLGPDLGLRLVLLFCFAQSIHYAVWLQLLPDDDRARTTPPTFRASYDDLCRDMTRVGVWLAVAVSVAIAAWAVVDLMRACNGYFRMARFHGHLELIAAALLILEGRARARDG